MFVKKVYEYKQVSMYMNEKTFLYSLLETPMGYIDWNDKMFLYEILEGYKSAYTMNKKHEE